LQFRQAQHEAIDARCATCRDISIMNICHGLDDGQAETMISIATFTMFFHWKDTVENMRKSCCGISAPRFETVSTTAE
jgi:hypothetical protein